MPAVPIVHEDPRVSARADRSGRIAIVWPQLPAVFELPHQICTLALDGIRTARLMGRRKTAQQLCSLTDACQVQIDGGSSEQILLRRSTDSAHLQRPKVECGLQRHHPARECLRRLDFTGTGSAPRPDSFVDERGEKVGPPARCPVAAFVEPLVFLCHLSGRVHTSLHETSSVVTAKFVRRDRVPAQPGLYGTGIPNSQLVSEKFGKIPGKGEFTLSRSSTTTTGS